jgi:hypothetical protein
MVHTLYTPRSKYAFQSKTATTQASDGSDIEMLCPVVILELSALPVTGGETEVLSASCQLPVLKSASPVKHETKARRPPRVERPTIPRSTYINLLAKSLAEKRFGHIKDLRVVPG